MTKNELLDAIAAKRTEIDAKQKEIDTFEPDEDEAENAYVEFLDECYENVKIVNLSWPASKVLKEMDECAFRCGLSDWVDSELSENPERFEGYTELQEELEGLENELSDLESELEELEVTEE